MKLLKEKYSDTIINFLKENKNLIENNAFDELYNKYNKIKFFKYNNLTKVLLEAKIDPIYYLTYIPSFMYLGINITDLNIPNNIKIINDYAFRDCTSLTDITIPNSVTKIGEYAFRNCTSLTAMTIPNSVTEIQGDAFYGCNKLTDITIPNLVKEIGGYSFWDCSNLTTINIPNSVKKIGLNAFGLRTKIIYEGFKEEWDQIKGSGYYKDYNIEFLNK